MYENPSHQTHYINKVINKVIPEFFIKKNNNDPVEIESLPYAEILSKFEPNVMIVPLQK